MKTTNKFPYLTFNKKEVQDFCGLVETILNSCIKEWWQWKDSKRYVKNTHEILCRLHFLPILLQHRKQAAFTQSLAPLSWQPEDEQINDPKGCPLEMCIFGTVARICDCIANGGIPKWPCGGRNIPDLCVHSAIEFEWIGSKKQLFVTGFNGIQTEDGFLWWSSVGLLMVEPNW